MSEDEPTLQEQVCGFVRGTCDLHTFISNRITPLLQGYIEPTKHEQAFALTYYRLTLFLESLSLLQDPRHFQAANSVCRSLFELLLDIELLCGDPSLGEQFFDFPLVAKYRVAQLATSIVGVDSTKVDAQLRFVNDPAIRLKAETLCERHWGRGRDGKLRWPEHWSGKKIFERARNSGRELYYRSEYFQQCQNVHAGGAGVDGIDVDNLTRSFLLSHAHSQEHVTEASELICQRLNLFQADSKLRVDLKAASASSGLHLFSGIV